MMPPTFWLVTTEHLEDRLWFKDEEDYMVAMNLVAVLSVLYPGVILAFTLMSNHVHFVLRCPYATALKFINQLKKRYSQYYSKKYGSTELLRDNTIDIRELKIGDESFERAVAYVQMNSVAANICLNPSGYPWGTGDTFFSLNKPKYTLAEAFSARALRRMTHSHVSIPPHYLVDDRGFIRPESYVQVKFVETVFKTPSRMNYFLRNSSKAKRISEGPSFNDQLVSAGLHNLCVSLYQKDTLGQLPDVQKSEVLRQLRYRFSADPNQMARVSGLSYEDVCDLLERFQ